MSQQLTAAEYRALHKPAKAPHAAPVARTQPAPASATPAPNEALVAAVMSLPPPTVGTYPGPCSWVLAGGRITASLPRPLDADRLRLVLHLPADATAVALVLAALRGLGEGG